MQPEYESDAEEECVCVCVCTGGVSVCVSCVCVPCASLSLYAWAPVMCPRRAYARRAIRDKHEVCRDMGLA